MAAVQADGGDGAVKLVKGTLRFLSLNDIYTVTPTEDGLGGYAQIATMLKKIRAECRPLDMDSTLQPDNTVLAVLGDVLGGGALQQGLQGQWVREILDYLHTDIACVGNHEFDYGADVLIETVKRSNFEWFGGNIIDTRTNQILEGVKDTSVRSYTIGIGDNQEVIRVGIFGVCTAATPKLSFPGPHVEFKPAIEHAAKAVEYLRTQENVDIVIGLTHLTLAEDKLLAKQVEGIDVILGGHDHDPYSLVINNTLILKCGTDCQWLGVVDLALTVKTKGFNGNRVRDISFTPSWALLANKHHAPDEGCAMIIQVAADMLSERNGIGQDVLLIDQLPCELDTRASIVRSGETVFANILADAMQFETKAEFALINSGFIRGNKIYNEGERFTAGDVMMELPFRKTLVIISMTGANLRLLFEQHLRALPAPTASFPNVSSNVQVTFYPDNEPMEKVKSITINDCPVDDSRTYTVAVTSFLANGGDDITAYLSGSRVDLPQGPFEAIIRYLTDFRTRGESFSPPELGRVVALG